LSLHSLLGIRIRHAQQRAGASQSAPAPSPRKRPAISAALICGQALFISPCAHAAEPNESDVEQGREIYGELCASCHGRDLVNPGGLAFDLRKFPADQFERFRTVVLNGKAPGMPAWRDKVSDEDVKLLWDYVRSGG
jgi:mono/diheme cytochrome c family protein